MAVFYFFCPHKNADSQCRVLAADVREVYSSICQLFELFLLAVFRSFSDLSLADIVGETSTGARSQPQQPVPQPDEVLFSYVSLHTCSSWTTGRHRGRNADGAQLPAAAAAAAAG